MVPTAITDPRGHRADPCVAFAVPCPSPRPSSHCGSAALRCRRLSKLRPGNEHENLESDFSAIAGVDTLSWFLLLLCVASAPRGTGAHQTGLHGDVRLHGPLGPPATCSAVQHDARRSTCSCPTRDGTLRHVRGRSRHRYGDRPRAYRGFQNLPANVDQQYRYRVT